MTDGYARLGLTRNPFVAEQQPGVADELWMERRVAPPATREIVQLIGPRGSGKTSQLLRWQRDAPGPYLHVEADRSRWRPPPLGTVVYWDEADRIPRIVLTRAIAGLAAGGGRAAIGAHRDLGRAIRHHDLTVRSVVLGRITGDDVVAWARRRIAAVAIDPVDLVPHIELAAQLAADSGGSWRVIGDRLHAWMAALAAEAAKRPQ